MARFRYDQFCPLACAAEIVGERWTLLVLRELLLGSQRFSDLKRRLPGLSSSILAERLERLEERWIVERQSSAPPTPAALYALTPLGRAFEPARLSFGAPLVTPDEDRELRRDELMRQQHRDAEHHENQN